LPGKDQHLKQAEHNEKLADALSKGQYVDWAVTVLFYAALHYVDSILAVSHVNPDTHGERQTEIQRNDTLKKVYNEFRYLQVMSRNARYLVASIDVKDWHEAKKRFDVVRGHLRWRLGLKP
jgi:hypothetical protein